MEMMGKIRWMYFCDKLSLHEITATHLPDPYTWSDVSTSILGVEIWSRNFIVIALHARRGSRTGDR